MSTLNKGKSALEEHVYDIKHVIAWENSKINTTNNPYRQKRCLEEYIRIYKKPRCDLRSPLMKTLDWRLKTLGLECNSTGLCIHFYKTRITSET